jgi:hypothetical protein
MRRGGSSPRGRGFGSGGRFGRRDEGFGRGRGDTGRSGSRSGRKERRESRSRFHRRF